MIQYALFRGDDQVGPAHSTTRGALAEAFSQGKMVVPSVEAQIEYSLSAYPSLSAGYTIKRITQ